MNVTREFILSLGVTDADVRGMRDKSFADQALEHALTAGRLQERVDRHGRALEALTSIHEAERILATMPDNAQRHAVERLLTRLRALLV